MQSPQCKNIGSSWLGKRKNIELLLTECCWSRGNLIFYGAFTTAILENLRNEVHKLPSNEAKFLFERDKSLLKREGLSSLWQMYGDI